MISFILPPQELAALARKCGTKKEMFAAGLKGDDLAECRRIKELQVQRSLRRAGSVIDESPYASWRCDPLSEWEQRQVKPEAWATARRWNQAHHFYCDYGVRIAEKIKKGWAFKFEDKEYYLSAHHSTGAVSVEGSRAACSYTTFSVRLAFDLLRKEAVWIGGLLTIRSKSDRGKSKYPCHWIERKSDGPGLFVRQGRIERRNHHVEDEQIVAARRAIARVRRVAKTCKPPKRSGWITRQMSIDAGNCVYGTDSFIQNRIVPWFRQKGYNVGDLTFCAIQRTALLSIEDSDFTRRVFRYARQPEREAA